MGQIFFAKTEFLWVAIKGISVTRLGDFWKFSVTKFLTNGAQIVSIHLGYICKSHILSKNCCGYFLRKIGLFFISNIWSHWRERRNGWSLNASALNEAFPI